ncbi:uncharacterized protein LOC143765309 [Ranitomeya variabilis]|uniref:uncharacterized protein LOC143765309 n=1 Tax=Ranitomeya variabilis TaxID=490064 RepID=UPI0040579F7E
MRSKELSMEVKQTIISLRKKKSIRQIAEMLDVAKSTVSYVLQKKERTGELGNSKRPGRPRKTTGLDDLRIISMVKENPLTTSTQVKKTLQEVGVSVSKSTIKRRLHEGKHRVVTARNRKAREDFAKTISKGAITVLKEHPLDTEEHPLDTEEHPLDAEEHPLDAEEHPLDAEGHPLDAEGHPLDAEEHPLDMEEHPLDTEEHPLDTEEYPLDTEEYPLDMEEHPLDMEEYPLDTEEHPLDTEELSLNL